MSKISSTDKVVTQAQLKEDLQNFYEQIRPFLNGEPGMSLDSTPTQNSTNGATSGGIYTALLGKQNTLTPGTGVSISGNTISAPVNYSTTEKVIGTWIDGKPVYERVITGTVTLGVSTNLNTKILGNVKKIIAYSGDLYLNTDKYYITIPYTDNNAAGSRMCALWLNDTLSGYDSHSVYFLQGGFNTARTGIYTIIIRYTKATD